MANELKSVRKALKMLILEDEPDDASLMLRELDRAGFNFEARIADDRASFITLLEDFKPDLILADFNLPDFSGLEALLIVQDRAHETPFIYVTGAIGEEFAAETIINGAWGFVLKSNLNRLPDAVEDALNSSVRWVSWRLFNTTKRVKNQIDSNIEVLTQINEFLKKGKLPDKKMSKKVEESIELLKEISKAHLENLKNKKEPNSK